MIPQLIKLYTYEIITILYRQKEYEYLIIFKTQKKSPKALTTIINLN